MISLLKSKHFIKSLFCSIILATVVLSSGCKKEPIVNDEYYVKYIVNSSTIYYNGKLDVLLNNEKNQSQSFSIDTKKVGEVIVGPVNKGFKSGITVHEASNNNGKLTLTGQILVSKNNGPFAIKVSDDSNAPRASMSLLYDIDF